MHLLPRLVTTFVLTVTALAAGAGCSAATADGDGDVLSSNDALTAAGGTTRLVFLGSSAFLRQCAGATLGCGAAVSSIPDSTPYFSAPSAWGHAACNQYFTFRANGRCVEARRLEVSDRHNFIEGNPGLFDGLGLSHSDGSACHGSGGASNVQITPGRHCDDQGSTSSTTPSDGTTRGGQGKSAPPAKGSDDGTDSSDDGSDPGNEKGGK